MATTRLVVVLLVLGTVLLLAVQNTAPALPLVFLGGQTISLPLGVWLAGAIGLGALTTVALTALLGLTTPPKQGSRRYKYEPQSFYEPASDPRSAARSAATGASTPRSPTAEGRGQSAPSSAASSRSAASSESSRDWQAWTNLQSPGQWDDWEGVGRRSPQPDTPASGTGPSKGWFGGLGGQRPADPSQQVNETWQELSQDWDDLEHRPYRAPGVSPVDDSLEELTQGWDDIEPSAAPAPPPRDFEAPQSPKQVYRDGSIYSYSYRDRANSGQTDHIYAPADDGSYETDLPEIEVYQADSRSEIYAPGDDHPPQNAPDLDEAGVVDADYRVLIPPYDASSAGSAPQDASEEDDWDDTDDILTP